MDWMTFTTELAKALAWPAVAAGALVYLREPIHEIARVASRQIGRIEKAEGFGIKFELAKQAEKQAEKVEEVADETAAKLSTEGLPQDEREKLVKMLKESLTEAARLRAVAGGAYVGGLSSQDLEGMQHWGVPITSECTYLLNLLGSLCVKPRQVC